MSQRLLDIRGLKTHFKTDDGWLHAVDGVDLFIAAGETLGVVGESPRVRSTSSNAPEAGAISCASPKPSCGACAATRSR